MLKLGLAGLLGGTLLLGAGTTWANDNTRDDRLEKRVEAKYTDTTLSKLSVDVEDGVVMLTGEVASTAERTRAERLARKAGARRVVNKLEVDTDKTAARIEDRADAKKEAIDDRAERGIGAAQDREERRVLQGVMVVDEAAVVKTVDPQLPERTFGLEVANGGAYLVGGGAVLNACGQALHRRQIAANHRVDPEEFAEKPLGRRSGLGRGGDRHRLFLPGYLPGLSENPCAVNLPRAAGRGRSPVWSARWWDWSSGDGGVRVMRSRR